MDTTVPYEELNRRVNGYMVNTLLSPAMREFVRGIQLQLESRYGDLVWSVPPECLHITLMDWIAPLVEYAKDKDELFKEIIKDYDYSFRESIKGRGEIAVEFNELHVGAGTIYLTGTDNGQYQSIRNNFLERVTLPPNTKQPPQIIHTSIARFTGVADLAPIKAFAAQQSIQFTEHVTKFDLVHETKVPMLERAVLDTYLLAG